LFDQQPLRSPRSTKQTDESSDPISHAELEVVVRAQVWARTVTHERAKTRPSPTVVAAQQVRWSAERMVRVGTKYSCRKIAPINEEETHLQAMNQAMYGQKENECIEKIHLSVWKWRIAPCKRG